MGRQKKGYWFCVTFTLLCVKLVLSVACNSLQILFVDFNRQIALSRVTAQLQQMKSMVKRTSESIKTNQKATEMYEDLGTKVRFETEETKQQILESKALLEEATKHRKHSMEYDALAKLIGSKPDRKLTELKREKLQEELKRLRVR